MLYRIIKEFAFTFALCLGERVFERILFPGLHLAPGRMITDDPVRAQGMTALLSEVLALMAMIWLFLGALYAIAWLYRRPLRWQVPPVVAVAIVLLIFAGSASQWYMLPTPR
jgi:hypothetical protein